MARTPAVEADVARLKAVQARVRLLARNHPWFADAIREAFVGYQKLGDRYTAQRKAAHGRAEPANPHSVDRTQLVRFSDGDYRTIALYRLGGLADVDASRPIVPPPESTGDIGQDLVPYAAERYRFPIDDRDRKENEPPLRACELPPVIAEQMLDAVELWAGGEARRRGESLYPGEPTPRGARIPASTGGPSESLSFPVNQPARNRLLARIHTWARLHPDDLFFVVNRLDGHYSLVHVNERIAAGVLVRGGFTHTEPLDPAKDGASHVFAWRINMVVADLLAEPPSLDVDSLDDPIPGALHVVAVLCLLTDREPGDYMNWDLASSPFRGDSTTGLGSV